MNEQIKEEMKKQEKLLCPKAGTPRQKTQFAKHSPRFVQLKLSVKKYL